MPCLLYTSPSPRDHADWYPLPEFIASQCSSGFDGPDSYTFGTLTPETTYYVYAFWVDEQTGEPASVTAFSESPFKTEKQVISAAVAKPSLWLTDGDDWAELNPLGYGHFKGYAILGARIAPAEGAVHWYSNIYKASDIASTDDQLLASSLINSKYYMDKTSYNLSYGVEWGGDYVIVSVAVDAAGARGPVQRVAFKAEKSAAEPLESIPGE